MQSHHLQHVVLCFMLRNIMGKTVVPFVLVLFIKSVISDEYTRLPFSRLMSKFNRILEQAKENGGQLSYRDIQELNELKQDMLEDCATGKLQEYRGKQKYDFSNIYVVPTKVYYLRLSKEVSTDNNYWVLPAVDCNLLSSETVSYNDAKDIIETEFNYFPYNRLLSRFNRILGRVKENGGYLSEYDTKELVALKKDMLDDCLTGKLKEYTGYENYDFLKSYVVPTRVYLLSISKSVTNDKYYWVLPAVNCNDPAAEYALYAGSGR